MDLPTQVRKRRVMRISPPNVVVAFFEVDDVAVLVGDEVFPEARRDMVFRRVKYYFAKGLLPRRAGRWGRKLSDERIKFITKLRPIRPFEVGESPLETWKSSWKSGWNSRTSTPRR